MIPEIGHVALCLASVLCLLLASSPILLRGAYSRWLVANPPAIITVIFMLITASFAAHVHAYAISDFTVLNVVLNSHSLKPFIYKITGSWGNHEGSMLLWVWVLALFGFLAALKRDADMRLNHATLRVVAAILCGLLWFILFTSNPFIRVFPPAPDGQGLNPLLQDIGLAIHPPVLYLGYVGFGVVFAYAMAGLKLRAINADWARAIHPWILLSWGSLTAGIGLGSWWAYRELGWGGWWFWDPVENVALLPWLIGGALMHANLVLAARGSLARWVALLAILSFSMSLIGTFIVRSGLITSVHAFASDPERGIFILAYIALVTGMGLMMFHQRTPQRTPMVDGLISRAGMIAIANVILVTACASILLAILYPLFLTIAGLPSISVGPPYFNAVILPLCTPLLMLAAIAPLLPWQGPWQRRLRRLVTLSVPTTIGMGIVVFLCTDHHRIPTFIGLTLSAILLLALGIYVTRLFAVTSKQHMLPRVPLRRVGSAVGHMGLALFAIGLVMTGLFKTTIEAPMRAGETITRGEYRISLNALSGGAEHNYLRRRATIHIAQSDKPLATLTPETRFYPVRNQETTEAHAHSTLWRDVVAVIGRANYHRAADDDNNDVVGVRLYIIPGQWAVWLGFICASMGSLLAAVAAWRKSHA
jgi:cytochrome c-type biogenesis protein CcmF